MIDFEAENRRLIGSVRSLLPEILPGGKFRGHEYVCGSIAGGDGDSLSVNMLTGKWCDFAEPEPYSGNDLISLIAMAKGLTNVEAAKQYGAIDRSNGHYHAPAAAPADGEEVQYQTPPQTEFVASMFRHSSDGLPTRFWIYREADRTPLFAVARYDVEGKRKQIRPWLWDGLHWRSKAPPKPRALYRLPDLAKAGRVLLVEGEKAADAAGELLKGRPVLTWMGGVQGWKHADWEPLKGREVTLWPDADDPGRGCMARIAERLLALGCQVFAVDTVGLAEGWDLADALEQGWDAAQVVAYAKPHTKAVAPSDPNPLPLAGDGPAAKPAQRVQASPPAGSQTLEHAQAPGSLVAMWQQHFVTKTNGSPYMNTANVVAAIGLMEGAEVWYDEFAHRIMFGRREWQEQNLLELTIHLQRKFGLSDVRSGVVKEGVEAYAFKHRRNPPRVWLDSLSWDGEPRLHLILSAGFGAEDNEYTGAVGRCFMVGMAARVLEPGCKVDSMPIFEGIQGVGKSSALKILGGEYFAEIHESVNSKDFYIAITGKMLCEISELHAFRRAELERIKGIITTATDRFRTPYGKVAQDNPRACVFAGTTNLDDWNTDDTGARRFWPVRCGSIDRDWLSANRIALFAEAVARYRRGEQWWDIPLARAEMEREARRDIDPWEALLVPHLNALEVTIPWLIQGVLELKAKDINTVTQRRVGKILRANGYENKVVRVGSTTERKWLRKLRS